MLPAHHEVGLPEGCRGAEESHCAQHPVPESTRDRVACRREPCHCFRPPDHERGAREPRCGVIRQAVRYCPGDAEAVSQSHCILDRLARALSQVRGSHHAPAPRQPEDASVGRPAARPRLTQPGAAARSLRDGGPRGRRRSQSRGRISFPFSPKGSRFRRCTPSRPCASWYSRL